MSNQITVPFVQQFSDMIIVLAQQKGSRLRDRVMLKPLVGNAAYFERMGPMVAVRRLNRHAPSPMVDSTHSRRMVVSESWEIGDALDKQDELRIIIDPKSVMAQNMASSLARVMDDLVIAAATGNATAVSNSLPNADNRSNVALPAGQIIQEDAGTTNSDLTIDKLIRARRVLKHNEVDDAEELTCVVNSYAEAALLGTTQVTSADYNTIKALVRGEIDSFMGFKFVRSERLLGTQDGTDTDPVKVLCFAKSGLGLAVSGDVKVRIAERPDMGFMTYVYASLDAGATRVEEEKVVAIECVQTA